MTGRRGGQLLLFLAVVLVTVAIFWMRPPSRPSAATGLVSTPRAATPVAPDSSASGPVPSPPQTPTSAVPSAVAALEGESTIADELNAPSGTVQRDLSILEEVFTMWLTNFPRTGNPVGENAEITAALTGTNPLKFAFIARGHRAINLAGELCDRWGTPFRFHQISGRQMEIRSAGPDRKFGTPDDALLSPP